MTLRSSCNAARILLALTIFATLACNSVPSDAQSRKQLSDAYATYLEKHKKQRTSFGHDVDIKGKMIDLAKTFVDKTQIGIDRWDNIKNALVSGVELWEADGKKGGMTEADIMRFVAKSALPYASPDQLKRLGLTDKTIKWVTDNGPNWVDTGAQSAGVAAGGGEWKDIGEELVSGGIDALCPQCAIGRRAIALAVEGGKAVEAWVEDQAVQAEYERWESDPRMMETFGTLAGQHEMFRNAKRVMMKYTTTEPSQKEIEEFILRQFQNWQAQKQQKADEADILAKSREAFLKLSFSERHSFGKIPEAQAEAYARALLETYRELMAYRTDRCILKSGREGFLSAAAFLVRKRERSLVEYRQLFRMQLRQLGCIGEEPKAVGEDAVEMKRRHIVDRLARLDYPKLEAVLKHMGITPPKSLFECMCARARYHSSSARSAFSPGIYLQPFDKRYSCHQPGPPCIVEGGGCTRHPLKNDAKIWNECMEMERMPGGDRLDTMLARLLAASR